MAKRKVGTVRSTGDETLVDLVEVRKQASNFFEQYQKPIIGGLAAIVLLVGGWLAYKHLYKAPIQQEASEQIWQAQMLFEKDSFQSALTNPGGGYDGFLAIADKYSGSDAGNLANYYAGVCYMNLAQYDNAIKFLDAFSPSGDFTPALKSGLLGDAYAEKKDFEKALSMYDKAASSSENEILAPFYLKKVAMLNEKLNKPEAANKAYTKIKEDYPTSTEARTVDKYIVRTSTTAAAK